MREINFKVWDRKQKKMYDVSKLFIHTAELSVDEVWKLSDGMLVSCKHQLRHHECDLREYSGLKDKNGIEMYEGDFIRWNKKTWVLVFSEYLATFWLRYPEDYTDDVPDNKKRGINVSISRAKLACEVIGNIYESA